MASEETVQQIHNFINYGSTFETSRKTTDLRYYYEPGDYTFNRVASSTWKTPSEKTGQLHRI
ncbi:MAG: hypothetical protein ACLUI0_11815 [Blautia massiliensis (ex Durand et al. 2017)]